jgi:hypothetical protein
MHTGQSPTLAHALDPNTKQPGQEERSLNKELKWELAKLGQQLAQQQQRAEGAERRAQEEGQRADQAEQQRARQLRRAKEAKKQLKQLQRQQRKQGQQQEQPRQEQQQQQQRRTVSPAPLGEVERQKFVESLLYVVHRGNAAALRLLLEGGADPNRLHAAPFCGSARPA